MVLFIRFFQSMGCLFVEGKITWSVLFQLHQISITFSKKNIHVHIWPRSRAAQAPWNNDSWMDSPAAKPAKVASWWAESLMYIHYFI